jgi:RimJ/RimL family protein N-acetyltransferase
MQLLPYLPGLGEPVADLPAAPGWPHADTAMGLAFADVGGETWLIVDDEGRVAGECGTKGAPTDDGVVEIGYGLAGPSRGRGLGGQAVSALLDELRRRPGVRIVEARVSVDNLASRRLLEALRFVLAEVEAAEVVYRRLV